MYCIKLKSERPGLDYQPIPGELGERLYREISQSAWQMWLVHQTKLINEFKLDLLDDKAQKFLEEEMLSFLFGV
ncbi:oxidative damage protection protein [Gammaproteobacteria bacterium]|nr:oxidative damage protection protein [Gammaproteobacteria bacterium]